MLHKYLLALLTPGKVHNYIFRVRIFRIVLNMTTSYVYYIWYVVTHVIRPPLFDTLEVPQAC